VWLTFPAKYIQRVADGGRNGVQENVNKEKVRIGYFPVKM